jgi:hypothetical protein
MPNKAISCYLINLKFTSAILEKSIAREKFIRLTKFAALENFMQNYTSEGSAIGNKPDIFAKKLPEILIVRVYFTTQICKLRITVHFTPL